MRGINRQGLELLKKFEGCNLTAYRDSKNILTIGIGHTGIDVHEGMTITDNQVIQLLQKDLEHTYKIQAYIQRPINDNQYSALVCLAFNIGTTAFRDSTLLHALNSGFDPSNEFLKWNKITLMGSERTLKKIESLGLTRRRQAERELYNTPVAQGTLFG